MGIFVNDLYHGFQIKSTEISVRLGSDNITEVSRWWTAGASLSTPRCLSTWWGCATKAARRRWCPFRPRSGCARASERNSGIEKQVFFMGGTLVQWLWKETHVQKVVGSNHSAAYWMGTIGCKNCNVCLKRQKETGDSPFLNQVF